jgi:hypothetical protein
MGSNGTEEGSEAKRRKLDGEMPTLSTTNDLLICCACGAQYEVTELEGLKECRICEVGSQLLVLEY